MKIEFEEETFLEDDDVWSTLFVKIDGGDWQMAESKWGTEDKQELITLIHNHRNKQILKYVTFGILVALSFTVIVSILQ